MWAGDDRWMMTINFGIAGTGQKYRKLPLYAVKFHTNIHKKHPIARPLGRGMGCFLWIQHLIDILPQFLQSIS